EGALLLAQGPALLGQPPCPSGVLSPTRLGDVSGQRLDLGPHLVPPAGLLPPSGVAGDEAIKVGGVAAPGQRGPHPVRVATDLLNVDHRGWNGSVLAKCHPPSR